MVSSGFTGKSFICLCRKVIHWYLGYFVKVVIPGEISTDMTQQPRSRKCKLYAYLQDEAARAWNEVKLKEEALESATSDSELEKEVEELEKELERLYEAAKRAYTNLLDAVERSALGPRSSSVQDKREDMKQKPTIDTSSQHGHVLQNVEASYPEECGGIPSKELHEAIMLEKALFSGVASESASHNNQPGIQIKSQSPSKMVIGEEPESSSTTKKAVLPIEPSVENEDAITLLVRMPDSSRHGRRFLKSDKLKYLFDFINAAGLVKPGTYRVVRPYPRRAFSLQDGALTFEELSLTNKQEALFLELLM